MPLHRLITYFRWGPPRPKKNQDYLWTAERAHSLVARHYCGNKRCCAPWHLSFGTSQDNAIDRACKKSGQEPAQHQPAPKKKKKRVRGAHRNIKCTPPPSPQTFSDVCPDTV